MLNVWVYAGAISALNNFFSFILLFYETIKNNLVESKIASSSTKEFWTNLECIKIYKHYKSTYEATSNCLYVKTKEKPIKQRVQLHKLISICDSLLSQLNSTWIINIRGQIFISISVGDRFPLLWTFTSPTF